MIPVPLLRATRDWLPHRPAKDDYAHVPIPLRRPLLDGLGDFTAEPAEYAAVLRLADSGMTYVEIARRLNMTEIDVWLIALDACTDKAGNVRWRSG